ncbi:MAG: hypothetical protein IKY26_09930, partial [Erysipelotrichaceae bacterium]|nr:hypothetical protein [Erysipelotrichaceae bacterium]
DDISGSVLDRLSNIGDMAGMMHSAVMGSSYNRVQGASVAELNRRATMKGMIHTVLNIDGREFAIATSDYIQEELAFKR